MFTGHQQTNIHEQIFALRYEAYLDKASIRENSDRLFTDPYDLRPNCHSHIEYIDGRPAGAIRACVYQPDKPHLTIPAQELFADEVQNHIGDDVSMVESNKFVVHPTFQYRAPRLKFTLFKFVFNKALEIGADFILTSPRASQVDFYTAMQFQPISGVKKSLALDFDVVLMACDLRTARQKVQTDPKYRTLKRFGLC